MRTDAELSALTRDQLIEEYRSMRRYYLGELRSAQQLLGRAMNYPELYPESASDDNFEVCVGDHCLISLVQEAASRLKAYQNARAIPQREARMRDTILNQREEIKHLSAALAATKGALKATVTTPVDWPASRGTTHSELMQMQEAAEREQNKKTPLHEE